MTSSNSDSFFASLLLKLHAGVPWNTEEFQCLQGLAGLPASPETPTLASLPTSSLSPPQVPLESEKAEPELIISIKHCLARKVDEKTVLPGTEAKKVYGVKQCSRNRAKGALLCPKCEEFYLAYKEKSKLKKKWEGFLNETPLDHLQVVGSKWFHEAYPAGLPLLPTSVPSASLSAMVTPADPAKETVLVENVPAKEVQWALIKLEGIQYIYNVKDGRTYLADVTKVGEDQILWEEYEGRFRNGRLDRYAKEHEEEED